jgi:glycosyltransferase involved in cell wall biosynthesis
MPDVVYLRSPSNLGIALVAYTVIFRKKMVFFSAHDTDFDPDINLQGYNPALFSAFIRLSNFIFVQNRYQNEVLRANFRRNGIEFGNVIEISESKSEFNLTERTYFLWIGRIEPFKRIELLFDIAGKMLHERFMAIAPMNVKDEYSDSIVKRIREVNNIDYIEFVNPGDLREYFSNAKGLICTSKYEGFSNTFLEAWNAGTPVYTLGVDPNDIILRSKGKLGFVFSSTDQFVKEIESVLRGVDTAYMNDYLKGHHCLEANVDRFLRLVSH